MIAAMTHRACLTRCAIVLTLVAGWLLPKHAAAQVPSVLPDYPAQVMLIKNTVTAVNHGNITGNYTVLRDLASEAFRQRNTAGDLADTFANLRRQKLDLSPILVTEPQLTQQPGVDQTRRLQLAGYFPTRPQAVRFVLLFQPVNGGWAIDEISLGVAPIESVVQAQRIPPPAPDQVPAGYPRTAHRLGPNAPQPANYR